MSRLDSSIDVVPKIEENRQSNLILPNSDGDDMLSWVESRTEPLKMLSEINGRLDSDEELVRIRDVSENDGSLPAGREPCSIL